MKYIGRIDVVKINNNFKISICISNDTLLNLYIIKEIDVVSLTFKDMCFSEMEEVMINLIPFL